MAAAVVMFSLAGLYTGLLARAFIAQHVEAALLRTPSNLILVEGDYVMLALIMALPFYFAWALLEQGAGGLMMGLVCGKSKENV